MRRPLLTPAQRTAALSICSAAYGFAIGIATFPIWIRPATPDQLPGFLKSHELDAHISFRFFGALVALTILTPIVLRPIVNVFTRPDTRPWARNGAASAMLTALWYSIVSHSVSWTLIPTGAAILVFMLLRRVDMHFTRRDAVLFPSFAAVWMAILDLTPLSVENGIMLAAGSLLALRLGIVFLRRGRALEPALCFAFTPLALLLESHFLARDQRHAGWPALVVVFVTPILMRFFVGNSAAVRRRVRVAVAFAIYPLAAYGYISASGLLSAEGKPRVSFFEEMQHVTPAHQMLLGAKPYVDIVPPHGLIQDALVDYAILKTGPQTLGNVLRTRLTINGLLAIACYALGAAATGSPDLGFLGFSAAAVMGQGAGVVRFGPSVIALVIAVAALRRRKPRWLAASGALAVIAGLTSIDFGVYSIAIVLFAALRFETRERKLRALAAGVIGGVITGVIAAIPMMIGGWFMAFLRVSLFEVGRVGPAYALTPFDPPAPMAKQFPELLAALFDLPSLPYMIWIGSLLVLAVVLANGLRSHGRRRAAFDALLLIAFYCVVLGISYAERHHIYFQMIVGPLLVVSAYRLSRTRGTATRLAVTALVLLIIMDMNFTTHFAIVGWLRHSRGPIEEGWHEVAMPHARGALFRQPDIETLQKITGYMNAHLGPGDTFFDFTNRGLMYFLLDRRMPVRQVEVAYYEPEELQREVIARIEANPRVRAAIMPIAHNDPSGVDLIGNDIRAPLVWKYLQEHFEPDYEEGPVAIWKRK